MWLPHYVAKRLNQSMANMGEYRGSVREVDLELLRGAYRIHELHIVKRSGRVPVPLLTAPRVELSISWRDAFRGALVGEVDFYQPELSFVDGQARTEGQSGRGVDWRERLAALFPVHLNQVCVHDGVLAFRNFAARPPLNVQVNALEACARNLRNVVDTEGRRDASIEARGQVLGEAPLELRMQADPLGRFDDFSMDLRILSIDLPRLNALSRHYARLDIAGGHGDFVMELQAREGRLSGYAKPLFEKLDILDWQQDIEQDGDNPLALLWEGFSGAVTAIFKNQSKDRFATRIAIEGRIDRPDLSPAEAIAGVLRNAFVKAYDARFETPGAD